MISVKDIEFNYSSRLVVKTDSKEDHNKGRESGYKFTNNFTLKVNSLKLNEGEALAITGVSGSGKSTFLKLMSGELSIQSGSISVLDNELHKMNKNNLRSFRLKNLGMIFQDSPLLEYLSVSENILLPAEVSGSKKIEDIKSLASNCGIENLLVRYPSQLSEGEKQRAAICRALISSPKIVLADEPTSSLDPARGQEITDLLIKNCRKQNCSLVMVTHDHTLLNKFDRTVDMSELGEKS